MSRKIIRNSSDKLTKNNNNDINSEEKQRKAQNSQKVKTNDN